MRRWAPITLSLLALLAASGCGTGPDSNTAPAPAPGATTGAPPAPTTGYDAADAMYRQMWQGLNLPGGVTFPAHLPTAGDRYQVNAGLVSAQNYWMCAWVEMLERLAYYTVRPVAGIYIMQADDPGGLHLTADDRALIFMIWAFVASLLPIFTGGIADRYGYKPTLVIALVGNMAGYVLMAMLPSKYGYLLGVLVLAGGTAFLRGGANARSAPGMLAI